MVDVLGLAEDYSPSDTLRYLSLLEHMTVEASR